MVTDIDTYLTVLFEEDEGIVYAPHLIRSDSPDSDTMAQRYFSWPKDRAKLKSYLAKYSKTYDVYVCPSLFADKDLTFKSSRTVWADFDEGTSGVSDSFPEPFLRISTSSGNKEHWYWKLSEPITDAEELERYNKRVAYTFGADKVAWDHKRILRPGGTFNHKYPHKPPVVTIHTEQVEVTTEPFIALPEVPEFKDNEVFEWHHTDLIGTIDKLLPATRQWLIDLPAIPVHRANALSSLAISAVESKLSRDEVMTLVDNYATCWEKFTGRKDRERRLCSIYNYAQTRAVKVPPPYKEGFTSYKKFRRKRQGPIDWVMGKVIHSTAFVMVAAPSGVGKTQFCLNIAYKMALAERFLCWDIPKKQRVAYLSLELNDEEMNEYLRTMERAYTPEQIEQFDQNFSLRTESNFRFDNEHNREKLLAWLDETKPNGLIIDSLSKIASGDLNGKSDSDVIVDFIKGELTGKRKMFVILIHHTNKPNQQRGAKPPKDLNSVFGSTFWTTVVSGAFGLFEIADQIEITHLKAWLVKKFIPFEVKRDNNLEFRMANRSALLEDNHGR